MTLGCRNLEEKEKMKGKYSQSNTTKQQLLCKKKLHLDIERQISRLIKIDNVQH